MASSCGSPTTKRTKTTTTITTTVTTTAATTTLIDVGIQTDVINDQKFIDDNLIFIPADYYPRLVEAGLIHQIKNIIKDVNWEQEIWRVKAFGTRTKRKHPYEEQEEKKEINRQIMKCENRRKDVSIQAGMDFATVSLETDEYKYEELSPSIRID
jgi:hypothetical protein